MEQMYRLFHERLFAENPLTDSEGRIRLDDWEMRPEVQGEGIGGLILETLKKFVIQEGYEGTTMMFDLMCAKGREEFYKKHGFIARPTKDLGPGMIQFIQIGSGEQ